MKTDFQFSLGPGEPTVTPADALWSSPLPLKRDAFGREGAPVKGHITYGDYFSAAKHYLTQNDMTVVVHAIQQMGAASQAPTAIDTIRINLLKHGAFYHPAHVVATMGAHHVQLVLNVAVSDQGQTCLPDEYAHLERLNREMAKQDLPRVFGFGQGRTPAGEDLPMFCGQWLQGYYEFHLTQKPTGQPPAALLWDTDVGHTPLTAHHVNTILQQAARILAYHFNPLTCEAIMDWHHGAGDFVVRLQDGKIDVALITVRRYAAMLETELDPEDPDLETLLNTWLVLFVNISLRLRLDRMDGVGQPTCFGPEVIGAICQGFWQGLQDAFDERGLPAELLAGARQYASQFSEEDLLELAQAMIQRQVFHPDETELLKRVLATHMQQLEVALGRPLSTT